jgi:hypothetical protein
MKPVDLNKPLVLRSGKTVSEALRMQDNRIVVITGEKTKAESHIVYGDGLFYLDGESPFDLLNVPQSHIKWQIWLRNSDGDVWSPGMGARQSSTMLSALEAAKAYESELVACVCNQFEDGQGI